MEREGEKVKANEEKEKEKEVNEDSRGRCRPKIQLDPDLKLKPIPFTKITDALGNVYQEAKTESGERVSVKVDNDGDLEFVQSPRFDFSDEKETRDGLAFLERHGYVIVKEVLTKVRSVRNFFFKSWNITIPSARVHFFEARVHILVYACTSG